MASVTLLHTEGTFTIPLRQAICKFSVFENNASLTVSPCRVQSLVPLSIFREFLSALERNTINITDTNFTELHQLCEEFGFSEIAAKLTEFHPSMDFKEAEHADAREQIAEVEEKTNDHSHLIAILQNEVRQLSTDFGRLVGEVSALRSASAGIQILSEEVSSLKTQIPQKGAIRL
jgi:Fe-S-cluster formation regulator IscX/YfhJ